MAEQPAHSELGPSGASRWMNCPGSVTLSKGKPNNSSDAAKEGTAAHAVAEKCLLEDKEPISFVGETVEGWEIDRGMVPHISEYVDMVRAESQFSTHVGVEERFTILKEFDIFGTADAMLIQDTELHVIDLKFGLGLTVDAYKNKQGMLYAWGALESLKPKDRKKIKTVRVTISQPRKNNHSTWSMPVGDLELFIHEVKIAAEKASSGSLECNLGEWCRWCKGKIDCPEQNKTAIEYAQEVFEPSKITTADLVKVFLVKDALKMYIDAVDSHLYQLAMEGEKVEGLKLVWGRKGNQKWTDPKEASDFLESMVGDDAFKPREPKTPTQLKKIAPDYAEDIEGFTSRSDAKLKLVTEADKGKAVVPNVGAEAQSIFSE